MTNEYRTKINGFNVKYGFIDCPYCLSEGHQFLHLKGSSLNQCLDCDQGYWTYVEHCCGEPHPNDYEGPCKNCEFYGFPCQTCINCKECVDGGQTCEKCTIEYESMNK